MRNFRAQGLPINTVILIAIGILILVLLVVFVLGGFKGLGAAKPGSYSAFIADCESACSELNGAPTLNAAYGMAIGQNGFCSLTYYANGSTTGIHCYDSNAYGACVFSLANGSRVTIPSGGGTWTGAGNNQYSCG